MMDAIAGAAAGKQSSASQANQLYRRSSGPGTRHAAVGVLDNHINEEEEYDDEEEDEDDDEEEDDDEDDEDDEDEDDEDEVDEGEPEEPKSTMFDEKFLSQLMAMDPLFGNSANANTNARASLPDVEAQTAGFIADTPFKPLENTSAGPMQQSTPFPNMPAYASAASTPSNEFYDGAINFLTDVLGSSDPALWNDLSNARDVSQSSNSQERHVVTQSTAMPPTRFQNIQPLISNLISRLKGQSVEEQSSTSAQVLEEDLVVLLQTLMSQRQSQMDKRTTRLDDGALRAPQDGAPTREVGRSNDRNTAPTSVQPLQNQNPAGLSIVDFEFGEDDDDPDFNPSNVNLDFGNSAEFAQALAKVTSADGQGAANVPIADQEQEANAKVWQHMLNTFGDGQRVPQDTPNASRRLRSTSKNVDKGAVRTKFSARSDEDARATSTHSSSMHEGDSMDDESVQLYNDGDEATGGSRKRKVYTAEEALERRREANRECARRQRARKKHETEQIRRELERIHTMQDQGQAPSNEVLEATRTLIGKRKRGRPLGSRNRKTIEETERHAAQAAESMLMSDLRADNRMLRTEMQRLREENAKLRTRVLQLEGFFDSIGQGSLMKKYPLGSPLRQSDDEEDLQLSPMSTDDESIAHAQGRQPSANPAEEFLSYNPFARGLRYSETRGGRRTAAAETLSNHAHASSSGRHGGRQGANREHRGAAPVEAEPEPDYSANAKVWQQLASKVSNDVRKNGKHLGRVPTSSLEDLLRAAARELGN